MKDQRVGARQSSCRAACDTSSDKELNIENSLSKKDVQLAWEYSPPSNPSSLRAAWTK